MKCPTQPSKIRRCNSDLGIEIQDSSNFKILLKRLLQPLKDSVGDGFRADPCRRSARDIASLNIEWRLEHGLKLLAFILVRCDDQCGARSKVLRASGKSETFREFRVERDDGADLWKLAARD